MPRPLAVLGGFGGVNIGDEVILRAVVLRARACGYRGPIAALGPATPSPETLSRDYAPYGVEYVGWRNPASALRSVLGHDLLIGGGQLIDGAAGARGPLMQTSLALAARLSGGRVLLGGVSTERLGSPAVRRAYNLLFKTAHRIATRDEGSLNDVLAITPSARSRSVALADFVFGMRDAFQSSVPTGDRTNIIFAVHHAPSVQHSNLRDTSVILGRMLRLMKPEHRITIVAHDNRPAWDGGFAARVAENLQSDRIAVQTFEAVDQCIDFYRSARAVVSARMHPIVMGACAQAFCVPLAGSRKVKDLADRLAVTTQSSASLSTMDDLAFAAAVGISDGASLRQSDKIERLVQDAHKILDYA